MRILNFNNYLLFENLHEILISIFINYFVYYVYSILMNRSVFISNNKGIKSDSLKK